MHPALTPAIKQRIDAFCAQATVAYRGFTIRPMSCEWEPYFSRGEFVWWGYLVCSENGDTNMSPGGGTVDRFDEAMKLIDCIHDAGGVGRHYTDHTWLKTYWRLFEERDVCGHAERENRPGWTRMQWLTMREIAATLDGRHLEGFTLQTIKDLQPTGVVEVIGDHAKVTKLGRLALRGRLGSINLTDEDIFAGL